MKFHSGTHSGTAVSCLGTINFLVIEKRGKWKSSRLEYKNKDYIRGTRCFCYCRINRQVVIIEMNSWLLGKLSLICYNFAVFFLINSTISNLRFMSISGSIVT